MKRLVLAVLVVLAPLAAHATTHRSAAVTRQFELEHPCPSTGRTTDACPGWWKDHIVPLACGGPDAVTNLQWQSTADAKAKDKWERQGCGG